MPHRLLWTPAMDAVLRRLRAQGTDWPGIAAAMGLTRNAVTERARRIGAIRQPRPAGPPAEDPARPPLPAGHPRSWGLLTKGTCLEATPYPLPVFDVGPAHALGGPAE